MSNKLINEMRHLSLPPISKVVLWLLCDVSNDNGMTYGYAPLSRLIEESCYKRNAVINALSWLESVGLITADRSNGRKTTYKITLENINQQSINDEIERKKIACKRIIYKVQPVDENNQLTKTTSLSCRKIPVDQTTQPVDQTTQPVDQTNTNPINPINHQEQPSKATIKNPKDDLWNLSKTKLPEYIDQEAWDGYIEMRIKIKKPLHTKRAFVLVINELEKMYKKGLDPNKSLDNSTKSNWTDVYPPRPELNQVQQKPKGAWDIDSCQPKNEIRTVYDQGDAQCLTLKN